MNIIGLSSQSLSANFGDILVTGVADHLDFKVIFNTEVILSETYYPDNIGAIYIRDISVLADMYFEKTMLSAYSSEIVGSIVFRLKFTEGNFTSIRDVTLYNCAVKTTNLSISSLKNIPLTRCFRKNVYLNQPEYISFYGSGNVFADLLYTNGAQDGFMTMLLTPLPNNPNTIYRLDVSPEIIVNTFGIEQGRIVSYMVYKNESAMVYKDKSAVVKYAMNPYCRQKKTFAFVNSFGAQETFTCTGDVESQRKWSREFGQINRIQQLISRELEQTNTINTGYLTSEQVNIVEDLLNARSIAVIDEYNSWIPVTIAEETFKVKSRRDELIDVEFKYHPASNALQYRHNPYQYKVFDFTFDKTFN